MISRTALMLGFLVHCWVSAWAYQADVEYIPSQKYFERTLQEVSQAKESIKVYMFVISARPGEPESKVIQLLDALVAAKERGIEAEVHLDQNFSFYGRGEAGEIEGKSLDAYQYLTERGIDVYFDDPANYTHAKAVVIDGQTTILGSSNWSKSALNRNNETNAIIRSEQFAQEVLEDLSKVGQFPLQAPEEVKSISIPQVFTTREDLMGQMVTRGAQRAYDIYLYLLKEAENNETSKLTVNYDPLVASLGIDDMTREAYRRQITKVLRTLQDDFGLISVQTEFDGPAQVVLNELPTDEVVKLPEAYWNYGWNRKLSFPGKIMLLLNQLYGSSSPNWHVPVKTLADKHHISETFIGDGHEELRDLNLVEIRYQEVAQDTGRPWQRGIYSPNPIYDPAELEKQFESLAQNHGQEAVTRAREYARVVYKHNDYEDVRTLIGLEKQYGREVMDEAVKILSDKRRTNPKRHMGYLVGTIKGLAEKL